MGTNGLARTTLASRLFDLFRDRDVYDILDPEGNVAIDPETGEKVTVTLQALDWQQNQALLKELEAARFRVRAEMEKNGAREGISDQVGQLNQEQAIELLLNLERPVATNVADLAPNGTAEETEKAKAKEEEATKKWEVARKEELTGMEVEEVREIIVRRQETLFIQARAIQDYINQSLCMMVIDPTSGQSVFSVDPAAENFVGHIMPEIRDQLLKAREAFLAKRADKAVRKAAEDKSFLPSGESPKPDTATPGETTETPRRSRRSPSPSTTVADG